MNGSDHRDGKTVRGEVVGGEFVGKGDADGRDPGVYVTIRLDGERSAVVGGPCELRYLPVCKPEAGK